MSQFPGTTPIAIYQGDEYQQTFILGTTNSGVFTPNNNTGFNIDIEFRPSPGSATLYASTKNGTIQIINRIDASGQFDVFMTSTVTGAFTWSTGAYDIQLSSGTGTTGGGQFEATTWVYGPVSVATRVSKITY